MIVIGFMENTIFSMENNDKIMALNEHQTNSDHINALIKKNFNTCIFLRDHPNSYYSREGYGLIYLGTIINILKGGRGCISCKDNERHYTAHTYDYYGSPYDVKYENCLKKIHTSLVNKKYVSCTLSQGEDAIVLLNPHSEWGYPEVSPDLCNEIEKEYFWERKKDPKNQW